MRAARIPHVLLLPPISRGGGLKPLRPERTAPEPGDPSEVRPQSGKETEHPSPTTTFLSLSCTCARPLQRPAVPSSSVAGVSGHCMACSRRPCRARDGGGIYRSGCLRPPSSGFTGKRRVMFNHFAKQRQRPRIAVGPFLVADCLVCCLIARQACSEQTWLCTMRYTWRRDCWPGAWLASQLSPDRHEIQRRVSCFGMRCFYAPPRPRPHVHDSGSPPPRNLHPFFELGTHTHTHVYTSTHTSSNTTPQNADGLWGWGPHASARLRTR